MACDCKSSIDDLIQDTVSYTVTGPTGPIYISPLQVALGAAVIIVNACVSFSLKLGIEKQLLIGAIRCVVQLLVLGYILVPIFEYNLWYLVLAYSGFMLVVGSFEATSRPTYTYSGMFVHCTGCIGSSAAIFLCYTLLMVVTTHPWWEPQYFIPILGMLLGNAVSGVSIGLTTLLEDFTTGRDKLELLLSIGASRWEATRESISRSVRVACMPIVNQMNVVGLVSIPGMMTGQILSGSDPSQAARYQMIVMFIIAGTTALASVGVISLAAFFIVDAKCRLRSDRLSKRDKGDSWSSRASAWVAKEFHSSRVILKHTFSSLTSCCMPSNHTAQSQTDARTPLLNGEQES